MSDETTPRDVKIVHLILASMGITSYQDQISVQLLDFAYRYTSQILQEAVVYSDYAHQSGVSQPAGVGPQNAALTIEDLKLAVASKVAYQFKPTTPKDLLVTLAAERNKRSLPPVPTTYGLRLPPEKYCLTGRDRDIDEDDDVIIAGYEKIDVAVNESSDDDLKQEEEPVENSDSNENSEHSDKMDTS